MNTALDFHDFDSAATDTLSSITDSEVDIERVPTHQARAVLKPQSSQRPDAQMIMAAAEGNVEAIAIRDAWRFSIPIKTVSREQFAAMMRNDSVVFCG